MPGPAFCPQSCGRFVNCLKYVDGLLQRAYNNRQPHCSHWTQLFYDNRCPSMCKESTELTVMRMVELLRPLVKQVDVHHLTRRCCCSCFCFVQPKATGLRWSGAMKSIKEEQQLISMTKVFLYILIATAACHMISWAMWNKQYVAPLVSVLKLWFFWPHLLAVVIILDPEGPTLPLPKCTIVTT